VIANFGLVAVGAGHSGAMVRATMGQASTGNKGADDRRAENADELLIELGEIELALFENLARRHGMTVEGMVRDIIEQSLDRFQEWVSWSSESLFPCLDGNCLDDASVSQHFHSAGASKCTPDGHRGATKAVDAVNTADAEICQNAWSTPRVSTQRSAGASDSDDSGHRGECERHNGR